FEEQIKYKNRKYTFKGKDRKKKVLARAIYLFSDFVQSEYQEKWQKRMAPQFDIKYYRNIRNKIYEEEVFRRLEKRIAPFKSLLNLNNFSMLFLIYNLNSAFLHTSQNDV